MAHSQARAISSRLQAAQVAIFNSLADAELQAALSPYGYDLARLHEGEQLYNRAVAAVDAAALALAAKKTATMQVQALRTIAVANYQTLAQTVRVILSEPELAAVGLNIKGGMPRRAVNFEQAARLLFAGARQNVEISAKLAATGYGAEWLDRAAAQHEAWVAADIARLATIGERQRATVLQSEALRAVTGWVAAYIKIARIVLRDRPTLLEKIGVKVRTTRSAAQVAGRQKAAATRRANRVAQAQAAQSNQADAAAPSA